MRVCVAQSESPRVFNEDSASKHARVSGSSRIQCRFDMADYDDDRASQGSRSPANSEVDGRLSGGESPNDGGDGDEAPQRRAPRASKTLPRARHSTWDEDDANGDDDHDEEPADSSRRGSEARRRDVDDGLEDGDGSARSESPVSKKSKKLRRTGKLRRREDSDDDESDHRKGRGNADDGSRSPEASNAAYSDDEIRPVKSRDSSRRRASEDDEDEDEIQPTKNRRLSRRDRDDDEDEDDEDAIRPSKLRRKSGDDELDGEDEARPIKRRRRSRGDEDGGGSSRPRLMDDIEDDDFIDDTGAVDRGEDDDDVIHTKGGWKDDDDIEARPGEEDEEPDAKPKTAFGRVLDEQKAKARRRRRKELDDNEIREQVIDFLARMMKARADDITAYETRRPVTNKLRMLEEVRVMFVKHEFREALLDNMMLAVIKTWLEPMKDGALPSIEVRTQLLDILGSFKVDSSWVERLENSQGLGKIIHYLSKKDDDESNRRKAKKLMMAWSRPFYNVNADFHELREDYERAEGIVEAREEARHELKKMVAVNQRKMDILKADHHLKKKQTKNVMAEIPQKTAFLFTKMAESETDVRVTKNRNVSRKPAQSSSKSMNQRMAKFKALRKQSSQRGAYTPSIKGNRD